VDGEKAHAIALVTHANAWLAGRTGADSPGLPPDGPTSKFIGRLTFAYVSRPGKAESVHTVEAWMRDLRRRGIQRLWFLASSPTQIPSGHGKPTPERMLAGFVGGGNKWAIVATAPDHDEAWRATWGVGNREAPKDRIWSVTYSGEPLRQRFVTPALDVEAATRELVGALTAIRDHAASQPDLAGWTTTFDNALAKGRHPCPDPAYYPDMLPPNGFPLANRRLLAMASASNVFGGMGSWNDGGPADPQVADRHEAVSQRLYNALLVALATATNADLDRGLSSPPPSRAR
jgi:hypothetical protein